MRSIPALWKRLAIASLLIHWVVAWWSLGPYHPDEHYQILEFMNAFLGRRTFHDLPWEYHWKIRPWLQPLFYGAMAKGWLALGVESPYVWAKSFRLVSATISWASLVALTWVSWNSFKSVFWRSASWVGIFLCGYMPYLAARTSSENLGGAFFWIGAAILVWAMREHRRIVFLSLAGACFGLSFWFRFQCGLLIAGIGIWVLFFSNHPRPWTLFVDMLPGAVTVTVLALAADGVGYGEWVFTPWRYLDANVFQGLSKNFGVSHPLAYFLWLPMSFPPLSTVLFFGSAWFMIKNRRHWATWSLLPFLAAHVAMAHKEFRFFFPVVAVAPLLFFWALDQSKKIARWNQLSLGWRAFLVSLLVINLGGIAVASLRGDSRTLRVAEFLYLHSPRQLTYYTFGGNEFWPVYNLPAPFYLPRSTYPAPLTQWKDLDAAVEAAVFNKKSILYVHNGFRLPPELSFANTHCRAIYANYPEWIQDVNFFGWAEHARVMTVYQCGASSQ